MRRPHRVLPGIMIALAVGAVAAACGGGTAEPTATLTPQPSATSTVTPVPTAVYVPVPARPARFEDYPEAVAAYLSEAGNGVLDPPCLAELIAEWAMAEADVAISPEERCVTGNTDADAEDEVVVLFTGEPEEGLFGLLSNVVIFDRTAGGYRVAFQSWEPDQFPEVFPQSILAGEDITGDGGGELAYLVTTCGAHTCTQTVHVVSGEDGGYRQLTPAEGVGMATADVLLEDRDGDGAKEIILHGGMIGSVGAGPQRERTEVYAWDGASYALTETTFDRSVLLYFHMLDADALFDDGNYEAAAAAYRAAIADESLEESGYHENERAELSAYALFRIGLSTLAGGAEGEARAALEEATSRFGGTVNADLAATFLGAYDSSGSLHGACLAVRDHIAANAAAFQDAWDYGYANPTFDPEAICPF